MRCTPGLALAMAHGSAISQAPRSTIVELELLESHLRATTDHARIAGAQPRRLSTAAADGARTTLTISSAEASLLWACVALVLWAEGDPAE